MKLSELVNLLSRLPRNANVFLATEDGIAIAEPGNLFPIKVYTGEHGVEVYIDDGLCSSPVIDHWVDLDEYEDQGKA